MDFGDVDAAFSENFCDPVDIQPMAMGFEDLWLVLSQCVHLRLLAVTAAFRAARDLDQISGNDLSILGSGSVNAKRRVTSPFPRYLAYEV